MMIKNLLIATFILVVSVNHAVAARDEIRIVGSPEVLPYVQKVAQNFTLISEIAAPSLEVTGTGTGFKLFCGGIGFEHPDINAASRRMTDSEFANCQTNGVSYITEIVVGLDGIVLVNSKAAKQNDFTISELYQGIAAEIAKNGKIVKNTSVAWNDIEPWSSGEEDQTPDLKALVQELVDQNLKM